MGAGEAGTAVRGRDAGRVLVALALGLLLWTVGAERAQADPGDFTEFGDANLDEPWAITAGPDGNLWFTSRGNSRIGRITPAGSIATWAVPGPPSFPDAITSGPDGNVWFTSSLSGTIGRITPSGTITVFEGAGSPVGIVAGPDGNLWFTSSAEDEVGRITPAGVITTFTDANVSEPFGITAGPDGSLWFTNEGNGRIGRITTAGAISTFQDAGISGPQSITAGEDGNLWFTSTQSNAVGRITTSGEVAMFSHPDLLLPEGITSGPRGDVWATSGFAGQVARISPEGHITTFDAPVGSYPQGIAPGPDGEDLWIAAADSDQILRFEPARLTAYLHDQMGSLCGISTGPDGNVWYTGFTSGGSLGPHVGRITPGGVMAQVQTSHGGGAPTWGPDGNLWLAGDQRILKVTPGGSVTVFQDEPGSGLDPTILNPSDLAWGPDGNLWFTNEDWSANGLPFITRMSPAGDRTVFEIEDLEHETVYIAVGPDGNLWFTTSLLGTIGRMTTSGAVTIFTGPDGVDTIGGLVAGPDEAMWFSVVSGSDHRSIGRIAMDGTVTLHLDSRVEGATALTVGADGAIWFANNWTGGLGRVTVDGHYDFFEPPAELSDLRPCGMTRGDDGNLWFRSTGPARGIYRFEPPPLDDGPGATIPGAPTSLQAIGGNGQVSLSWQPPADDGGAPIIAYRIYRDGQLVHTTADGSTLTYLDTGLTNGTEHQYDVTAVNSAGEGFSTLPVLATPEATIPMAPTGLVATPGNGQVSLSWQAPLDDGGSPITDYQVFRNGNELDLTGSGSIRTYVDTGLTNGTQHQYAVAAVNEVGVGLTTMPVVATPTATTAPAFGDVGPNHPFFADIQWMNDQGISTGFADGSYGPGLPVSRQAMSAFMFRLAGSPASSVPTLATFADVGTGHPFFEEIEWMASEEITTGYPGSPKPTYRPGAAVTRQAMSAFMFRLAGSPAFSAPALATFADVGTGHPFFEEIEWMASEEITTGYPGVPKPTYRPGLAVTRQAMSAFMRRMADGPGVGV